MSVSLYRHFDADHNLLYVGVSVVPLNRTLQHEKSKDWFGEVSMIKVEHFACREDALRAEKAAISKERPLYNIAGSARRLRGALKADDLSFFARVRACGEYSHVGMCQILSGLLGEAVSDVDLNKEFGPRSARLSLQTADRNRADKLLASSLRRSALAMMSPCPNLSIGMATGSNNQEGGRG